MTRVSQPGGASVWSGFPIISPSPSLPQGNRGGGGHPCMPFPSPLAFRFSLPQGLLGIKVLLGSLALNPSLGTQFRTLPKRTSWLFLKIQKAKEERANSLLGSLHQLWLREQRLERNKGLPQTRQIKGLADAVTGKRPRRFVTEPSEWAASVPSAVLAGGWGELGTPSCPPARLGCSQS